MRRPVVVAVCLLTIHVALLAWSGYRHSPTIDEPAHLAAGISHWQFGRMDLYSVNPPLVRMVAALPVMLAKPETSWGEFRPARRHRAEFNVGEAFADANGPRIFWLVTLARWACIPFTLLGGWMCFQWTRELFGNGSGLVALTLWCFSPTILGNGALITADVPAAALCVTTLYFFWHWLRVPSWSSAFLMAVSLGLGLLTKSSLILLCGLLPVLWLVVRAVERWQPRKRSQEISARQPSETIVTNPTASEGHCTEPHPASMWQQAAHLALTVCVAVLILNLGYGFEGTGKPIGEFAFRSKTLGGHPTEGRSFTPGNRFENSWLAACPVPFPENYVIGIDRQKLDFETGLRSYLFGTIKKGGDGWWWFYLYAAAVKVPLGTWLLALLAIPVALRSRDRVSQLVVLTPLVCFVVLVSSQMGLNFFRYLLPAFPFAFIWVSQVFSTDVLKRSPNMLMAGGLALTWSVVASLFYFPHSLAYFNELVGGPKTAYRIMADANLDWGQDLIYLHEWIEDHPSAAGLELRYYGPVTPALAGLDVVAPSSRNHLQTAGDEQPATPKRKPEWMAISVTKLAHQVALQRRSGNDRTSQMEYLYNREPDARVGFTIQLYRIGGQTPSD